MIVRLSVRKTTRASTSIQGNLISRQRNSPAEEVEGCVIGREEGHVGIGITFLERFIPFWVLRALGFANNLLELFHDVAEALEILIPKWLILAISCVVFPFFNKDILWRWQGRDVLDIEASSGHCRTARSKCRICAQGTAFHSQAIVLYIEGRTDVVRFRGADKIVTISSTSRWLKLPSSNSWHPLASSAYGISKMLTCLKWLACTQSGCFGCMIDFKEVVVCNQDSIVLLARFLSSGQYL